ncbi:MAG: trehalase family glycosidase [candidate division KSB1 bacterium]|nr:trehalase family glycosidase [candidate division KSB1 bacterium]MDZ7334368.1 trehalase family glycosidase [candidate division KSB1 bacterium]MDZ7356409.1 trehalase family glycosidase [candidate division KSB1 bacterium]MDZ7399283.1 trehalase family glycosidase [candidate division KSB1 bacterium]
MGSNNIGLITLPSSFPKGNYTPHGYIDNPYHSMVFNRSGVIRSVPPLGFGWWRRNFNGSYGGGDRDHINYLCFLLLSVSCGGKSFVTTDDFSQAGIDLVSKYHSKHVISYDWQFQEIDFSLKYFLATEHSLVCLVELRNFGATEQEVFIHATHLYGLWETRWWGSDGLASRYAPGIDAGISKIWAYGDIFALGSNKRAIAHKATGSSDQWKEWLRNNDLSTIEKTTVHGSGPLYMVQSYHFQIPAKEYTSAIIVLSRGANENNAVQELRTTLERGLNILTNQLAEDESFWSKCPVLEGDWPDTWRHGWVYDWETLRMNVRQPIGIYEHPWDAMQIHSPRAVLGETSLDMMTLSYADGELAKQVFYGTFADAPMPNVPCSREDGSMNMISADGSECGTAPMWGYPFHTIKSIYAMNQDRAWIKKLYPFLKAYIEWWLKNRTDPEGWLHCNNSWESGQDGSQRFLIARGDEGAVVNFVRTVDVEAAMAEAMANMALFAEIAGQSADIPYWKKLAQQRLERTRSMFVDGWFRDFDARVNQPIILDNYFDVMMLAPLTCHVATQEQIEAIRPMFAYFRANPQPWLEWPPLVFTFCEAAWFARMQKIAAEVVADIADRTYLRTDSRSVLHEDKNMPFSYRIPGVANEFWPVAEIPAGGENYGWGATLPMNIIRNIIGFRETENISETEFYLAPAIPERLFKPGKRYTIKKLNYQGIQISLSYTIKNSDRMEIELAYRASRSVGLTIVNARGMVISKQAEKNEAHSIAFDGKNEEVYRIRFE